MKAVIVGYLFIWSFFGGATKLFANNFSDFSCSYLAFEDMQAVDAIAKLSAEEFEPIACDSAVFGFDTRQFWLRVDPGESLPQKVLYLEMWYRAMDYVNFYIPDEKGTQFTKLASGDMVDFLKRPIHHRGLIAPLDIQKIKLKPIYIEVKTSGSLQFPISLYDGEGLVGKTADEFMLLGLYYGILASMIIYNLFLYFSIRDRTYLYYVAYIGCYLLFQAALNGIGLMYLWPSSVVWNNVSIPILIASMFFFMFLFTMRFLNSKVYSPRLHVVLRLFSLLAFSLAVISYFLPLSIALKTIVFFSILSAILVWVSTIFVTYRGYVPARYFLVAWSVFLLGIISISFKNFGVLPSHFLTDYGMQVGSALEALLLSLALGNRIKEAEKAKTVAEIKATQLEWESARDRAIAATTQMLVHDVKRPFSIINFGLDALDLAKTPDDVQNVTKAMRQEFKKSFAKAMGLLTDILEVSTTAQPQRRVCDLSEIVESSLAEVQSLHKDKNIKFEVDYQHHSQLYAEQSKIQRLFSNIIANAVEAQNVSGKVWILSRDYFINNKKRLRVVIGNDNSYIPEEFRAKLFDRFYTQGKINGTGLGLAIAKKVVEAHDGVIRCVSDRHSGTEFVFDLPVSDSDF